MLPAFLITFREVIEATLIVATILGVLIKLGHRQSIRTVISATCAASVLSILLLGAGSLLGVKVKEVYTGATEEVIEGTLMITSAFFITWAVFFLHKYFGRYKTRLLSKIRNTVEREEQKGLFALTFTAVFREGFEIVLFLTTIYFSDNPIRIFTGFSFGIIAGLLISFALFSATLRMPVFYAFRASSALLILFAAGLLSRGIHEFAQVGFIPEIGKTTLLFLPEKTTTVGEMIKAVFGLTKSMDSLQIALYTTYTAIMLWYVFLRQTHQISNT